MEQCHLKTGNYKIMKLNYQNLTGNHYNDLITTGRADQRERLRHLMLLDFCGVLEISQLSLL